jgi:hypothetical protein
MGAARVLGRGLALLAAVLLACAPAAAQPSESAVKAAFLTRFAAYVAWPRPSAGGPVNLCLVGGDPFGPLLDAAARGQQIDGRPIAIRRFAGAEGTDGCQIAFVEGASGAKTAELLQALRGKPILTVSDTRGGSARGMIHFVVEGGRVRFHIDQAAAQQSGLNFSSRLLAIALTVRTGR